MKQKNIVAQTVSLISTAKIAGDHAYKVFVLSKGNNSSSDQQNR